MKLNIPLPLQVNPDHESTLMEDFYTIKSLENNIADAGINASVEFNPEHDIFRGHFPGNPVVPGVCLLHVLKNILTQSFHKDLLLFFADNIKFTAAIDPRICRMICFEIKYKHLPEGVIQVHNKVLYEDTTFLKFAGKYK